jgi:hypothetical protein
MKIDYSYNVHLLKVNQELKIETMRKAILFIVVIFIIQDTGFCKNDPLAISKDNDKQTTLANDKSTYYLNCLHADSSIFCLDTLSFTKIAIDRRFPRFEFNSDSKFYFFYETSESHRLLNFSTGELETRDVTKSKMIEGNWKTNDKQKDIHLTLIDKLVINYSIVEGSEYIYFIKVK